jgi:hypothetical protein
MMDDSLDALVADAWALPWSVAKSAKLEQALRRADPMEDNRDLCFQLRLELVTSYTQSGERVKAMAPFVRLLHDFDSSADFAHHEYEFLWSFKFVVDTMYKTPEVSLDQTASVLEDMERRWRLAGLSPHPVLQRKWGMAHHLGQRDRAEELFRAWSASPRDHMCDCEGCDPTDKLLHLVETGRHEDAVRLTQRVLGRGRLRCDEQPQQLQTKALPAYVAVGRLEEAAAMHRQAYRKHRQSPADLEEVGNHIQFLALSGNESRALELVQAHLAWLDAPESPYGEMGFSACAARAIELATERQGPGPGTLRRRDARVPAAEVAALLRERSLAIAAQFDARNGTTHQSDRVHRMLFAEPGPHVALGAQPRRS